MKHLIKVIGIACLGLSGNIYAQDTNTFGGLTDATKNAVKSLKGLEQRSVGKADYLPIGCENSKNELSPLFQNGFEVVTELQGLKSGVENKTEIKMNAIRELVVKNEIVVGSKRNEVDLMVLPNQWVMASSTRVEGKSSFDVLGEKLQELSVLTRVLDLALGSSISNLQRVPAKGLRYESELPQIKLCAMNAQSTVEQVKVQLVLWPSDNQSYANRFQIRVAGIRDNGGNFGLFKSGYLNWSSTYAIPRDLNYAQYDHGKVLWNAQKTRFETQLIKDKPTSYEQLMVMIKNVNINNTLERKR